MSSPRKFADKIALMQQKQAEGDVAFNTIICEVGEAKQRVNRDTPTTCKLGLPTRTYEKPFDNYQGSTGSNGMNHSDSNHAQNYLHQPMKMDNDDPYDRLLQPPDNASWRRTNSDPFLHYGMMPTVVADYHARFDCDNNDQAAMYQTNEMKSDISSYTSHQHNLHVSNVSSQRHPSYDANPNYHTDRSLGFYPSSPIPSTASVPVQTIAPPSSTNSHTTLGPRYSGGSTGSNVLMLPPAHHPRGGSLPDLRTGNAFHPQQLSFSTTPSPPSSINRDFFRSSSPQDNVDPDLYILGSQQQFASHIGPLKQSPSIRRRHSPIGEVKQSSPRRQNSPTPDISPNQQTLYRVEPSSPQSQSSYSPQNSPHLLASPGHDHGPFSPQQSADSNGNNQQGYFALPTHLEQITLDHNFYTQQQSSSSSSSSAPSQQANHHHPSSPTSVLSALSNDINAMHLTYFRPRNFYPTFVDNTSANYGPNQTAVNINANVNQKSPTIPNIILTDVDSSKLDLSKEMANDFSSAFDALIDSTDLQLTADDFLLNGSDLSLDPRMCDETFRMEN